MISKFFTPRIRILWALLAAGCLLYSLSVLRVGSGTLSFAMWLAGAAFFLLCWFLAGNKRWMRCPKRLRCSAYILIAVVGTVFLICFGCIFSHFFDKGEDDLDVVIVLGAQMRDYGPSIIYRYRLDAACEYLEDNPDTICVTTGRKAGNESISEGEGGASYLVQKGIGEERIIAETESADTYENIANTLALLKETKDITPDTKIGIVTNGFHVFRGIHIAENLTDAQVSGIAAYTAPWYVPNNVLRECFGILRDFFAGRL